MEEFKSYSHPSLIESANVVSGQAGKHSKLAPHFFCVHAANNPHGAPVGTVQFQDGPIAEDHADGVHNEDLLVMVLARLNAFQETEFRCRDNAIAITHIETALMFLAKRTNERRQRQVEGTHKV